ncbi:hypothetical protein CFAM422_009008 [Trichoderma lentiforme]|uniref:Uncharacterized protein n=1 Tax=Trichoderma lentiforme TaxID=1567552 RepID=A0A9P5CCB4_9HYPO|nr:hypothetical protein CFAM422_009008 [Trichoderma lentiforme]
MAHAVLPQNVEEASGDTSPRCSSPAVKALIGLTGLTSRVHALRIGTGQHVPARIGILDILYPVSQPPCTAITLVFSFTVRVLACAFSTRPPRPLRACGEGLADAGGDWEKLCQLLGRVDDGHNHRMIDSTEHTDPVTWRCLMAHAYLMLIERCHCTSCDSAGIDSAVVAASADAPCEDICRKAAQTMTMRESSTSIRCLPHGTDRQSHRRVSCTCIASEGILSFPAR